MTTIFLIIIGILFLLDTWTTITVLRRGGREMNPFLSRLIGVFGRDRALILYKAFAFAMLWWWRADIPIALWAVMIAVYVVVVANNFRVARKV